MKTKGSLAFAACLFGFQVQAEGSCPPGYYPHNVPGLRGCAPIPGYGSSSSTQRWVDAYGTLVWWNSDDGIPQYSYSKKYTDESLSERTAIKRCQQSGGSNCNVAFIITNGYMAVGRNEQGGLVATSGANPGAAKKELFEDCKNDGNKCEIVEIVDTQGWYEDGRR